ncbi:MAG: DNA-processing protein DprA [Pseudoclavibacter sp.]
MNELDDWRAALAPQAPGRGEVALLDGAAARLWGSEPAPDQLARVWWSILIEPGDAVAGELIDRHGPAVALDLAARPRRDEDPRLPAARARWEPRAQRARLRRAVNSAVSLGAALIEPAASGWPAGLDDLRTHAPVILWRLGPAAAWGRAVSIVGARSATAYGDRVAAELGYALAESGAVVVSGGAYGIDRAAHRGALAQGGLTVAILAGGLDRLYPAENAALFARIRQAGLILSEVPPGTTPTKWRFLARNRLIAAAGAATAVVEAGARSGALNTAHHALELGRPVGAVPGPVTSAASAGTNALLRDHLAEPICGPADLRELAGLGSTETAGPEGLISSLHVRVADALSVSVPRREEEIAAAAGIPVRDAAPALAELVAVGLALHTPRGWLILPAWTAAAGRRR